MSPTNVTLVFCCFDCGEEFKTEEYPADSMEVLIGTCVAGAFERLDGAHHIPSLCDACGTKEGIPTTLPSVGDSFPMCGCGRGPELAEDIPVCFDCLHGHEPGQEPGPDWLDDEDFVAAMEAGQEYAPCCEAENMVAMENGGYVCHNCGAVEEPIDHERSEKLRSRYDI